MTAETRRSLTIYYACRRAIERVDQLRDRKSGKQFSPTLHLERQGYVDLANQIAEETDGLEKVA